MVCRRRGRPIVAAELITNNRRAVIMRFEPINSGTKDDDDDDHVLRFGLSHFWTPPFLTLHVTATIMDCNGNNDMIHFSR